MNPLTRLWLPIWDKIIGTRWHRYYPDLLREKAQAVFGAELYTILHSVMGATFSVSHRFVDFEQMQIMLDLVERQRLSPHFRYRHFTKPKKNGTLRQLAEPDPHLKAIQHAILKQYLKNAEIHPCAVGFRPKKSTADHVWAHVGAEYIITADIEDFFPNTSTTRVADYWEQRFHHNPPSAQLLTLFTTYQGCLPQGAPTSPMLSNVLNYRMDKMLEDRVLACGGRYTRYGDDLVFSWQAGRPAADFRQGVETTLHEFGYRLNQQKGWQTYQRREEPEITGAVLGKSGKVRVPQWVIERIHELEQSDEAADQDRLAGYRAYRHMLEDHTPQVRQHFPSSPNIAYEDDYDNDEDYEEDEDYDDDEDYDEDEE